MNNEYDSSKFDKFIGKTWEKDVDESDLRQVNNFESLRVLEPDSMMTMDFREDRLNVHIDKNGKIISFNFS
jgi:hypothetical protein